ncbi:hypothetical protein [Janthinobacterium sp. B9-8]|uniref:hypothetical protein n=1 Tax=Janthinobacterium sp. B9-8 TaxID=1236179 RepID=UPI00061CF6EF|nr:hypothetical protein [Janthinobacterium sp. B9-8]AMC34733.1 hypothetical protein VN23_08985 [Janthinobacterium sp. B9-8]
MSWTPVTFPMREGLNLADSAILVKAGEAIHCRNYEAVDGGYRRADGYAWFDGSLTPAVVPGSGPIRGVFYLNGLVYAFRNATDGLSCKLYQSGVSSWALVTLNAAIQFNTGTFKIKEGDTITGAISGATALVKRVCTTDGDWSGVPAPMVGALVVSNITGTWQNAENIKVGATVCAKAASLAVVPVLQPDGKYQLLANNFGGAAGTQRIYGCDGKNPAFEFDGTVFAQIPSLMPVNTPKQIEAHSNYLWLAFNGGSLQHSAIGNPLSFVVALGADQLSTGAEITSLNSFKGEVMAIGCDDRVLLLYGATSLTFQLKTLTQSNGALFDTACEVKGGLLYACAEGLQSIGAVQQYGDFASSAMSRKVKKLINSQNVLFSYPARSKGQLRLVMNDKTTLIFTVQSNGSVVAMRHIYPDQLATAGSWRDVLGSELILGGFDNGRVAILDSGTSFAGAAIQSVIRLAYVLGKRGRRMRAHRLELEMQASAPLNFHTRVEFDYGAAVSADHEMNSHGGGGGTYDTAQYDQSRYSAGLYPTASIPMRGIGENLNLFIVHESAVDEAFTLSAATFYLSEKGPVR